MTHEDMVAKVSEHDSRLNSAEKRIEKLENAQKDINELNGLFKELSVTVKMLNDSMNDLHNRLRVTELAPGEKYEKLKIIIITALISAIVGGAVAAVFALF